MLEANSTRAYAVALVIEGAREPMRASFAGGVRTSLEVWSVSQI